MLQQALDSVKSKYSFAKKHDNFINGQWVPPVKGQYFKNVSPINGQTLSEVARSTAEDIELALDAGHKAFEKWGKTSVTERATLLMKIADVMAQNLDVLALVETLDNGKPIRETTAADLPLAIDHFRYFASCIRAQEGSLAELDGIPFPTTPRTLGRCRPNHPMELPLAHGSLENCPRTGGWELHPET